MELEAASRDHLRESRLNNTGDTASLPGQKANVTPAVQGGGVRRDCVCRVQSFVEATPDKFPQGTDELEMWGAGQVTPISARVTLA